MSNRIHIVALLFFQFCILRNCEYASSEDNRQTGFNRLANADSPYLREHADNPVDWYEWGPEALEKAKRENKPIIVSIGYASCHWCHVMERESFMDTAVARMMNKNFVSIKIDREQRPDIDQIYLNAAQLISGHAGWPLNAFALPDGKPFYAATYFPKDQWMALLKQVNRAYRNEKPTLVKQAEAVTNGVQSVEMITSAGDSLSTVDQRTYADAFSNWINDLDFKVGGLKGAPKFPMPANWEFLLQYHALTGNQKALAIVTTTLDQMAAGGIYDQLGGGFCRYATDSLWRIPHFEKMLYDNAQLVSLYAHALRLTRKAPYQKIINETLAFIETELMDPEGGFYSSVNADSEGEEGKFYVWTKDEVKNALDARTAGLILSYFRITDPGNWEGSKNVLYTTQSSFDFAKKNHLSVAEWEEILTAARNKLKEVRSERHRPSVDNKILTSWNALMLTAYTDAYVATRKRDYLETALKNARFLEAKMIRPDGGLWRNYKDGKASIEGFLDDYALLAQAFINLYQSTFDIHWLERARRLSEFAIKHFGDPNSGMFYYTSAESEGLIARRMEVSDNVIPSSNSVFAFVLFQLGEYYQQPAFTRQSKVMLNQVLKDMQGPGHLYYANWFRLAGLWAYQPFEVAVMGEGASGISLQLQEQYYPLALFSGGKEENLPLLENKYLEGKTMIYVCRNRTCKLPVEDVAKARRQLE